MLKNVREGLGNCPVLLQSGIVFVVALLLACVHGGIGGLQNDDMQISFMLNGGGARPALFPCTRMYVWGGLFATFPPFGPALTGITASFAP